MSNAHVNHHHGVVLTPTRRPKASNAKKRNKALAKVRKAVVLASAQAKKVEQKAKM